eukprot:scaffold3267_cov140-Cylindrotheca_fusiformis.AAC.1
MRKKATTTKKRKAITATTVTTVTTSLSPATKRGRRSEDAAQARHRKLIKAAITQQQMGYDKGKSNFLVQHGPFFGLHRSDLDDFVLATYAILPIWQGHARQYRTLHNTDLRYSQLELHVYCRHHIHQGSGNLNIKSRQLSMSLRALDILSELGDKKLPVPSKGSKGRKAVSNKRKAITTTPVTTRHRKLIEAAITQQQMGYDKGKTDFLVKYGPFFGLD